MKQNIRYTLISLLALYTLGSCRDDVEMILSEDEYTGYTRTPGRLPRVLPAQRR